VLKMCGVRVNFPSPISMLSRMIVDSMKDELPP
jgi:hypothetical protein